MGRIWADAPIPEVEASLEADVTDVTSASRVSQDVLDGD